jgi:hypothetical protein
VEGGMVGVYYLYSNKWFEITFALPVIVVDPDPHQIKIRIPIRIE